MHDDVKSFACSVSAFVLNPRHFTDQTFEFATANSIRVKLFT